MREEQVITGEKLRPHHVSHRGLTSFLLLFHHHLLTG